MTATQNTRSIPLMNFPVFPLRQENGHERGQDDGTAHGEDIAFHQKSALEEQMRSSIVTKYMNPTASSPAVK